MGVEFAQRAVYTCDRDGNTQEVTALESFDPITELPEGWSQVTTLEKYASPTGLQSAVKTLCPDCTEKHRTWLNPQS